MNRFLQQEPLEDSSLDILGKAMRGLAVSLEELAARAQLPPERLRALLHGAENESDLRAVANALQLCPDSLLAISRGEYHPQISCLPKGLLRFQTDFGEMRVNSYLVWDPVAHRAIAFDTGADTSELLEALTAHGLHLEIILLTHSHSDHIFDLDRLIEKTRATAWIAEALPGTQLLQPGQIFHVGALTVEARLTSGHSPAGITYVIRGLQRTLAIVGDALFAGSIGGPHISYPDALHTCASEILSLPDDTLLCPGHGPLTTVGQEKTSNPFFPKRSDGLASY